MIDTRNSTVLEVVEYRERVCLTDVTCDTSNHLNSFPPTGTSRKWKLETRPNLDSPNGAVCCTRTADKNTSRAQLF